MPVTKLAQYNHHSRNPQPKLTTSTKEPPVSRTYKDQRQFDRKQEYRKREYQDKTPIIENDYYDVMQTINPDWSDF